MVATTTTSLELRRDESMKAQWETVQDILRRHVSNAEIENIDAWWDHFLEVEHTTFMAGAYLALITVDRMADRYPEDEFTARLAALRSEMKHNCADLLDEDRFA